MSHTQLKYGNRTLTLEKSDDLVAVRSSRLPPQRVLGSVRREVADRIVESGATLGDLQVLRVAEPGAGMEETLEALRAEAMVDMGSHAYFSSSDQVPFVPTGQIYVEFAADVEADRCQQLIAELGLEVVEARSERKLILCVTPSAKNPIKTCEALQAHEIVLVAEPDLATPGRLSVTMPNDPLLGEQWHLRNTGFHRNTPIGFRAGADARVVQAWMAANTIGSPDVVVAIIDDGFDLSHPDLGGPTKVVAPWDFTGVDPDPSPNLALRDWHGTACAGVAVGKANQGGIVGAAPNARWMPIRWGTSLSDAQVESWFDHARSHGAAVVSCSWSAAAHYFPLSTRAQEAIHRCARDGRHGLGTVICFAAGNENRDIDNPESDSVNGFATHPDVIAVAASNSMDQRSNYSNYGARISLCAPSSGAGGSRITTSDVRGSYLVNGVQTHAGYSAGDYTNDFGGTSSACPLVAGIAALILSVVPSMKAKDVRRCLESTARRIGDPQSYDGSGHSPLFGYGCVDAHSAVVAALNNA